MRKTPMFSLLLAAISLCGSATAQQFEWIVNYGHYDGSGIFQSISADNDQNIIVSGEMNGNTTQSPYVFDNGNGLDTLYSNGLSHGYYLAKFDSTGQYQWSGYMGKEVDMDDFTAITNEDGDIFTAGVYRGQQFDLDPSVSVQYGPGPNYGWGAFVSRINADGTLNWLAPLELASDTAFMAAIDRVRCHVDDNSNVYVTGEYTHDAIELNPLGSSHVEPWQGPWANYFLASYGLSGTLNWATSFGSSIVLGDVKGLRNGSGVVVAGVNTSQLDSIDIDPGTSTLMVGPGASFMIWFDQNGNIDQYMDWQRQTNIRSSKCFDNGDAYVNLSFFKLHADSVDIQPGASSLYVPGFASTSGNQQSYYLIKYADDMTVSWYQPYCEALAVDDEGQAMVNFRLVNGTDSISVNTVESGTVYAHSGDIAMLNGNGEFLWVRPFEPVVAGSFCFDAAGNFYMKSGYQFSTYDPSVDYDFWSDSAITYPSVIGENFIAKYSPASIDTGQGQDSTMPVDEFEKPAAGITCYPNPSADLLTVMLSGDQPAVQTRIMDVSGRVLNVPRALNYSDRWVFDVRSLAPGMYFMSVLVDETWHTTPFIKK